MTFDYLHCNASVLSRLDNYIACASVLLLIST